MPQRPTEVDLLDAIQTLPARQRQALILYYFGDLSIQAVADAMQTSEGTIKRYLHRARARLRTALRLDDDVAYPTMEVFDAPES